MKAQILQMKMLLAWLLSVLGFVGVVPSSDALEEKDVEWRIVNRFRLFDKDDQLNIVLKQIESAVDEAQQKHFTRGFPSALQAIPENQWDPLNQQYKRNYTNVEKWVWTISVSVPGKSNCTWTLPSGITKSGCNEVVIEGVKQRDTLALEADGEKIDKQIIINHRLVVVMGDSYSSGEGVPDVNKFGFLIFGKDAQWWDRKCHRSLAAGGVQASMKWASRNEHSSVTLLSYACSGAEIGDMNQSALLKDEKFKFNDKECGYLAGGVLSPYCGRETNKQLENNKPTVYDPLESQVNQAIRDLCPSEPDKIGSIWKCNSTALLKPDLIILSAGGNDAGFGDLITEYIKGNCSGLCTTFLSDKRLAGLDSKYKFLTETLNSSFQPTNVLLLDYPNLTQSKRGDIFCNDAEAKHKQRISPTSIDHLLPITANEYEMARNLIIKELNKRQDTVITAENWHRIKMFDDSEEHGICAEESWFTGYESSEVMQGKLPEKLISYPTGDAHPNVIFYSKQSEKIVDWMKANWDESSARNIALTNYNEPSATKLQPATAGGLAQLGAKE